MGSVRVFYQARARCDRWHLLAIMKEKTPNHRGNPFDKLTAGDHSCHGMCFRLRIATVGQVRLRGATAGQVRLRGTTAGQVRTYRASCGLVRL